MRQGELLALRWEDLDLETGTLAIRHTLPRSTRELAEPKTDRARQVLRMGPDTIAMLREHRRRQARIGAFVFTTPEGRPLDGVNVTHALQRHLARLGLPASGSTTFATPSPRS